MCKWLWESIIVINHKLLKINWNLLNNLPSFSHYSLEVYSLYMYSGTFGWESFVLTHWFTSVPLVNGSSMSRSRKVRGQIRRQDYWSKQIRLKFSFFLENCGTIGLLIKCESLLRLQTERPNFSLGVWGRIPSCCLG